MTRINHAGAAVIGLVGCVLSIAAARADVTYTYTGNDFTTFSSPTTYTTSDSVTGSITLTSALADNISSFINQPAASIVSFSFSDGQQTITNANATLSQFDFETNSSGDITYWQLVVGIGSVFEDSIGTSNAPGIAVVDQGVMDYDNDAADNFNDPGTWTTGSASTPVPEPGSLVLLGTGLAALAASFRAWGAMRRRQASEA